ncbi:Multi antimicrobial extrusion protein (Na(+)/drug antiporter), MATE family of MDR efflux pump [Lachnospiraceae bacterium TWA4]|nr:Multi antimicrobial extrusion protein (Na(+)/drug antiporter), MATE family of MDR efflux pump [Lachnospiraceae bacterium TWA4]
MVTVMKKTMDLTRGGVFLTISLFALPMLIGNILQQLYNIVDTWIVGQYISSDALAAVGSIFTLMTFITSILIGLCMGSSVVFSLDYGRNDEVALERRMGTAFIGIGGITILLMILSFIGMDGILWWMNTPDELYEMTKVYLSMILWGIPAVFIYNFFGSYLKALGNSVAPLLFLVISSVINIILDFFFVMNVGLGIFGVAFATVIAQYVSAISCLAYVLLKRQVQFRKIQLLREDICLLFRYSIFTCLQQSVMNLGILVVQGIVNSFGTAVMSAFATGVKIDAFAYMPAQEYANAFSTFLAQNRGAKKDHRVKEGIRCGLATSGSYCLIASMVLWFFAKDLMMIFIRKEEFEVIRIGIQYLHIEGAFYIGIGCLFLLYALYRALGKPEMSLILTIISLGTRVIIAKISAITTIGVIGIWWAIPIGWFLADLTGIGYFIIKKKKLIEV